MIFPPRRREITNEELADLPECNWENLTIDTTKYRPCVLKACEVDRDTYGRHKRAGGLCQELTKYYIA